MASSKLGTFLRASPSATSARSSGCLDEAVLLASTTSASLGAKLLFIYIYSFF